MSHSEMSSLSEDYSTLNATLQNQSSVFSKAMFIFTHNLSVAILEVIPVLGLGLFGYSTYVTSRTIEALALAQPQLVGNLPAQVIITLLLALPHSWLELPAYSLSITEGIYVTYSIWKRTLRQEYHRAISILILVALQLFVAATVEAIELQYQQLAYYMWLPSIAYLALAYILLKRISSAERYSGIISTKK